MLMALTITAIVSTIISILALGTALYCAVELISFKKATHTVQYIDPTIDKANEDFIKASNDIDQFNKEYSSELETEMPFFYKDKEDLKVNSL